MLRAIDFHKLPARARARGNRSDFGKRCVHAEFFFQFARCRVRVIVARIHVARRAGVPIAWMHVLPLRTTLEKKFAAFVEDENMDCAVPEFLAMHFAARAPADHMIILIHHIKDLAGQILRLGRMVRGCSSGEVCERHPLREAQFFSACGFRNADGGAEFRPVVELEKLFHLLPPLAECGLHQLREQPAIALRQRGVVARCEADHCRLDLRHGGKKMRRQQAQELCLPSPSDEDGDCAVFLRARFRAHPLRELPLEREDHPARRAWLRGKEEHELAGNVIRQIAEYLYRPALKQSPRIKLQRVSVHHIERRELPSQPFDNAVVLFEKDAVLRSLQRILRQRSKSRTDFQPRLAIADADLIDDPARHVLVVQKILAEALRRLRAEFGECGCDGG